MWEETIILQQWLSDHKGKAMMKSLFLIYFYYPSSFRSIFIFRLLYSFFYMFLTFSWLLFFYPLRRRYLSPSPWISWIVIVRVSLETVPGVLFCHSSVSPFSISLNTNFVFICKLNTKRYNSSLERTVQFDAKRKNIIRSAGAADLCSAAFALFLSLTPPHTHTRFYTVSVFPFSRLFSRGYGSMGNSGRVVEFCGEEERVL